MNEVPVERLRSVLAQVEVTRQVEIGATISASDETGWLLSQGISLALNRAAPEPMPVSRGGTTLHLPELTLSMGPLSSLGDPAPPSDADLVVTSMLAEGGMGRLLLARQQSLGREVVVKQVKPQLLGREMIRSLLSEARITGSLEHPSIVPVHALGRDPHGHPLMVMKRIDGVLWSALASDPGHPAWVRLLSEGRDRLEVHLRILSSVSDALSFAHSHGVLHRDIKPDNVMVGYFGEVYLLDWGIALRKDEPRGPGPLVGTPAYLAPEMVCGDTREVDERTDVYLLGATLHRVLTGELRHSGPNLEEVLVRVLTSAPVRYGPEIPGELAAICNRATARAPEQRFSSVQAFREAVDVFLRRSGILDLVAQAEASLNKASEELERGTLEASQQPLIEGRFALEQALRAWPDHARSQGLLTRCRELQLSRALALSNLVDARMYAGELPGLSGELAERLRALEAQVERQVREASELIDLRQDRDPTINDAARYFTFSLIGLLIVGATLALQFLDGGRAMAVYAGVFGGSLVLAGGLRRRLVNRINRKVVECFLAYMSLLMVHQAVRRALGEQQISLESDVQAALSAAIAVAVTLHPIFWTVVAVMALCWLGILVFPHSELQVVRGVGLGMSLFLVSIGVWARQRHRKEQAESALASR